VAPVIARYGAKLGIPQPQPAPAAPQAAAQRQKFSVVGRRVPRLHAWASPTQAVRNTCAC
jgi:hypothetical protein